MSRADLEAAAEAAWIRYRDLGPMRHWPRRQLRKREYIAGYIRGRLDQAEADAQIAEQHRPEMGMHINVTEYRRGRDDALAMIAAEIRKGVE